MARSRRHDVDYFPFYVKDGKTLFLLESKYGCKGTGFFTNVMRFLSKTPDHHVDIKDEIRRMMFFADLKCDLESGMDMLNLMAKTGKIDSLLWEKEIIASEDFLKSISDAYTKRKNSIITVEEIRKRYGIKEIKGKSKPAIIPKKKPKREPEKMANLPDWLDPVKWMEFVEWRRRGKKPFSVKAQEMAINKLTILRAEGNEPCRVIDQSLEYEWQGLFALKGESKDGNREGFANSKQFEIDKAVEEANRVFRNRRKGGAADDNAGASPRSDNR